MASPLSGPAAGWFQRRFGAPTPVQIQTWEAAARGNHILAVAPTGSGKTLAAFLVALDSLYTGKLRPGALRVLYVSPLKALGTDIRENLAAPLVELKKEFKAAGFPTGSPRIGIRTGDTPPAERRRQLNHPPEILVTTPESLNILLLSAGGRGMLGSVQVCIIDEIHAIAPNRRGTMLVCGLERLVDLAGEFQRIGLTATVRPPEAAAAFLGGFTGAGTGGEGERDLVPRPVTVVAPPAQKEIVLSVEALPAKKEGPPDADGFWKDIAERLRRRIRKNPSTLAFIDSRKWSEKLARLLSEGEDDGFAWAHHGSLSKDMRRLVETRLKEGRIKAVVATGSLELGIDIGPLDEVALIGAPSSASAALQRAGRAGHRPGEASRGRIYPITPGDLLVSAVLAKRVTDGRIERLRIPENPLDMLAQTILALTSDGGRTEAELWSILRRAWCFRTLPRESFDAVLAMLRGRYADTRIPALRPQVYRDGEHLIARPGTRLRLYSGGAIPDLGMYAVRAQGTEGSIGVLDEKFVWESQPGMVFPLGNSRWRIISIGDKDVTVAATDEPINTEPFWRAEGRSWDEEFAGGIAGLLETAEAILAEESGAAKILEEHLADRWGLDADRSSELAAYLRKQRRRSGAPLPHRALIVAEAAADPDAGTDPGVRSLFLHTFRGGRVNRPLALALQAAWAARSPIPAIPTVTDESIVFSLNDTDVDSFVSLLYSLTDLEGLIRGVLEATPFFGGLFREAAGRAMLLPASTPRRRQPLWMTRQRSRMLMEAVLPYPDFPLMAELWRSCLNDEFAMESLEDLLIGIRGGEIGVRVVRTAAPSPFADSAVRRRLSRRMTSNMRDQGDSRALSSLETAEIRRLSRAGALRPRIPAVLIRTLDVRRRRIERGYAPGSVEALKAWVAEREVFDAEDWEETLAAAAAEASIAPAALEEAMVPMTKALRLGPGQSPWIASADAAWEWERTFPAAGGGLNPQEAARLLGFWLAGRGPQKVDSVLARFGLEGGSKPAAELLRELAGQSVVLDCIGEGEEEELCDEEGLEILLRRRRRLSRNAERPLPLDRLPAFLAIRQGLDEQRSGEAALADVIGRLEGFSGSAGLWEAALFPVRRRPYRPGDLDALTASGEVLWVGCGERRVTWLSAEGGWIYPGPEPRSAKFPFPSPGDGLKSFWEIADALGTDSGEASARLWERVWEGSLTADGAEVLRRAVAGGFRADTAAGLRRGRGGRLGWAAGRPLEGRWYAPLYAETPEDLMESDQLLRERVRLLLRRYGVLSKPILEREIPAFRWPALSRTLALMELADEVIGGRWFEGLPMPQFMDPAALPRWRSGAEIGGGWHLDAADPASPCGLPGMKELPPRREGTWLAWNGSGELCAFLKPGRKSLDLPTDSRGRPREGWSDALAGLAAHLTGRAVRPLVRLAIGLVNGGEPPSEAARGLEAAGFVPNGAGDWIRRAGAIGGR